MKKWYLFHTEEVNLPKLHQLGGELRRIEIQYPEKLHQLGGEIMEQDVSDLTYIPMPPAFAYIPWRHHVEIEAVAENKAVAENGTVAKNPAIITADSGIAENNSENDGLAVQEENLSFDVLEALYPKKDLTAAYRQTSVNEWNVLSAEDKLKAIAYIQTNLNDGTATFNDMFLSQFLKRKLWC